MNVIEEIMFILRNCEKEKEEYRNIAHAGQNWILGLIELYKEGRNNDYYIKKIEKWLEGVGRV